MVAKIYFKDSVGKPSVTIEGLTAIKARTPDIKSRDKNYNERNFHAFVPFHEESYSFIGTNSVISVAGTDILYVELLED